MKHQSKTFILLGFSIVLVCLSMIFSSKNTETNQSIENVNNTEVIEQITESTEIIIEPTQTIIVKSQEIHDAELTELQINRIEIMTLNFIESIDESHLEWMMMTDEERFNAPTELKAKICNMSTDDFIFLSRVVEAESDRSSSMDGRILIAATILNRVTDSRFPNSISGVLTQSGQFTTVSGGYCSTSPTLYSEWSIVKAVEGLKNGSIPNNILYFNCIGYNGFEPYGLVDGNYFMCA